MANRKAPPVWRGSKAPGKLVLLGEYAVLEGGAAWVTAVNRFVHAEVIGDTEAKLEIIADDSHSVPLTRSQAGWVAAKEWELASRAYTAISPDEPRTIRIDSSSFFLPGERGHRTKAGFGSSAAVVAALLALSGDRPAEDVFAEARAIHHEAQGKAGSGVDTAAAVFGGTFRYRLTGDGPEHDPIPLPERLRIVPVWTKASASTPEFLRRVVELKASSPGAYDRLMDEMKTDAEAGIECARQNDVEGLLDAVRDYGRRMSQLGRSAGVPIVTPGMDDLAGVVADVAAVKPSGAGGGDVVLVFTTAQREDEVRRRLESHAAVTMNLGFGAEGCETIS